MITTVLITKISEVENKIPDNSKYITSHEFNTLAAENFAAGLKQAHLMNKTDFDNKLTMILLLVGNQMKYIILNLSHYILLSWIT